MFFIKGVELFSESNMINVKAKTYATEIIIEIKQSWWNGITFLYRK